MVPEKDDFLKDISDRTSDLEKILKVGYVDISFGGSTSIKKVLPIVVPELTCDNLKVTNGTDAMEAFVSMLYMPEGADKQNLRREMLEYCKLDTLGMVRIFGKMEEKT